MGIQFKKSAASLAKAKAEEEEVKTKKVAEAEPEEKVSASKAKLGGAKKSTVKATTTVKKENLKTGEVFEDTTDTEQVELPIAQSMKLEQQPVVGYSFGVTINLGDFNSAKISTWMSVPTTLDEAEEAHEVIKGWVDKKVLAAKAEIEGEE